MRIVQRDNKRVGLKLTSYHEDTEVLEYMQTLENKAEWIRNLTRKQMLKDK